MLHGITAVPHHVDVLGVELARTCGFSHVPCSMCTDMLSQPSGVLHTAALLVHAWFVCVLHGCSAWCVRHRAAPAERLLLPAPVLQAVLWCCAPC